jgi:hypothetical protein
MNTDQTELHWPRLDHTVVFFDNVHRIPNALQHKYSCAFCYSQAVFAKLDSDDQPVAFYCGDHVFEARRGR